MCTQCSYYLSKKSQVANLARWMLASTSLHTIGYDYELTLVISDYSMGLKKNDKVALVYPPGLKFIVAFVACLRAASISSW
ncbi:hypothetical protein THRCLA_23106 [Thraustotheca clavata]|uniref:Uncharacterized protein n=1 Tax=Thraustotheca clavata TaxID=74557 RepID=A0A1V9YE95_9STRA|nr:hypothetical protein THRCLA_23106 [Thraustotheca clavata]